jgi:hypothetical protein
VDSDHEKVDKNIKKELKDIKQKGSDENTLYVKVLKGRGIKPGAEDTLYFKGNTAKIENIKKGEPKAPQIETIVKVNQPKVVGFQFTPT